jgi:hypothetical protein
VSEWPVRDELHPSGKLVGSGLSRTGTRSVYAALLSLGVPSVHYPFDAGTRTALESGMPLPVLEHRRAILDISSAAFFEQIASAYPGSRVIHTRRDRAGWLEAVQRHYDGLMRGWAGFSPQFRDFGEWITRECYGSFPVVEARLADAFDAQEERVAAWAADHPGRVLVCDVFTGVGAAGLPGFAGVRGSLAEFPRVADDDEIEMPGVERTLLRGELGGAAGRS